MTTSVRQAGSRNKPTPEFQVVAVSPRQAKVWLERNVQNRIVKQRKVMDFARDMSEGNWRTTGQAIQFDTDGNMLDGQHRCLAVIESACTVHMLVATGLDPEIRGVIDTGTARTAADALRIMDGYQQPHLLASIAKKAAAWDRNFRWFRNTHVSHTEIREYVADPQHDALFEACRVGHTATQHLPVTPTILGLAYYLCARTRPAEAHDFWVNQVIGGLGLEARDPAYALRRRYTQDALHRGDTAEFNRLANSIHAWNLHLAKSHVSVIRPPQGGWTHDNFPEPKS